MDLVFFFRRRTITIFVIPCVLWIRLDLRYTIKSIETEEIGEPDLQRERTENTPTR